MKKTLAILLLAVAALSLNVQAAPPGRDPAFPGIRAASGGGPDVWYDASTTHDANETGDATFYDSEQITVAQAGTATTFRIYISNYSSDVGIKVALYDGSNNLIAQGSGTVVAGDLNSSKEIAMAAPVAVTATNYRMAWQMNGGGAQVGYLATAGSTYKYHSLAYASFPEDPLSAGTSFATRTLRMGFYVD